MQAVVTTGTGGYDKLVYKTVAIPRPSRGEVLLRVLAAGVNNTELNTRLGWYSASVKTGTDAAADPTSTAPENGGWNAATPFPLIQGTDCCGEVVEVGEGADPTLIGRRVLVRACMRPNGFGSMDNVWMGSDFDGAFAQFVKVPAGEVFPVDCGWSDAELATIPCAYGTAENMVHRAGIAEGMRVLVPGASGGVGSATVQLARRRGAEVIGISGTAKHDLVRTIGADRMLDRGDDLLQQLGAESIDVVIDNVAGPGFATMLKLLKRGGIYVSSGAIAGPLVELDMRVFYLKNLTLLGCTAWDEPVFPNLVSYIERGEIRPLLDRTYPLDRIAEAQQAFLEKRHTGKIVLIPAR
ncbi:alcohol dehydrogenase family protein [Rhizobium halophytocola]|uniref:NADPH:quinone reductase-like Zn-dependent oxidoreductase n=1 Tax=Rhizobium halophytocola TaxID=735519 RepID=A0ABS4DT35_9HYPH|nr:alcohol dehydrogenase family protein [Rhizobium halophytocola]MBP1848861.1 NADPH:quinone reductase-like Zn-dependent oxidoreductase [Rhizobium halophytocola]